mmetsp:Transcript_63634/g.152131  ORF Transcript_63634/g.152131 Transcript_63634/m.152131 type:complete len:959 (+) Transcript_63634:73-2949(+)
MVELLATFGAAAKELFDYNREMYQFDQGQRLDRELLRLEMQIKRFQLFREDIRDLVELTVGKMEMYHVVGALVLECTVIYYTEGRIRTSAPPFLLGLYWLSAAGTFTYVLLCVWFSMYASISSHSFGVRLLTRFVRLPIPGSQQMSALNARLTDFESQGTNIMRIPFVQGVPNWQGRNDADKDPARSSRGQGEGDEEYFPAVIKPGEVKQQDLLEAGVPGYQDDEGCLQKAAVNLPGKHIKLFRELQAKWQCYDAYARVCMSFGVNHVCMTMSYYMIGLTVLEYRSPSIMFALVTIFQATNLALAWLDVAGLKRKTTSALELVGAVPPFVACCSMATAPHSEGGRGQFDPSHDFPYACAAFFFTVVWLEGLLHLAWPSEDMAMLPKRFRSVLFLDVFGMADDAVKGNEDANPAPPEISLEDAEAADEAVHLAEAAVRRWNELPRGLDELQKYETELEPLRAQALMWRKVLNGEAAKRARARGDFEGLDLLEPDPRGWWELTEEEKEEDPFSCSLLGPFLGEPDQEVYYYDLENREFVRKAQEEQGVLSLTQLSTLVKDAEQKVTDLFHGRADLLDTDLDGDEAMGFGEWCCYLLRGCTKRRKFMERERRLPWRILLCVTRASQVSWFLLGLSLTLQNTGVLPKYDLLVLKSEEGEEHGEHAEHGEHGEVHEVEHVEGEGAEAHEGHEGHEGHGGRRLAVGWDFQVLNVTAWPRGLALARAVSCLRMAEAAGGKLYMAADTSHSIWSVGSLLQPLTFEAAEASAVASLCPQMEVPVPCMLANASLGDALKAALAAQMPNLGPQPLRSLTAAQMPCRRVGALGASLAGECMLLAGWDGVQLLVAALPLEPGAAPLPLFDVLAHRIPPKRKAKGKARRAKPAAVSAMSMEDSGRLWVLWSTGRLESFDLLGGQLLGSWKPQWPAPPRAICSSGPGELLVLGSKNGGAPQLLRASRVWRQTV